MAPSVCVFLFVYEISREPLNEFAPNSCGRRAWSLARTSLKAKVKGEGHQGHNRYFSALSAACVWCMFGKTSLASSFFFFFFSGLECFVSIIQLRRQSVRSSALLQAEWMSMRRSPSARLSVVKYQVSVVNALAEQITRSFFTQAFFTLSIRRYQCWFVTVRARTAFWHLFDAAVKISVRHAASAPVLDTRTGTFVFQKTHWILHRLGVALPYLADELSQPARASLRSTTSSSLFVRRTRLSTVGDRAFPVAAARVWNCLPQHVTSASSLSTFRSRLKTHLFSRCYPAVKPDE